MESIYFLVWGTSIPTCFYIHFRWLLSAVSVAMLCIHSVRFFVTHFLFPFRFLVVLVHYSWFCFCSCSSLCVDSSFDFLLLSWTFKHVLVLCIEFSCFLHHSRCLVISCDRSRFSCFIILSSISKKKNNEIHSPQIETWVSDTLWILFTTRDLISAYKYWSWNMLTHV